MSTFKYPKEVTVVPTLDFWLPVPVYKEQLGDYIAATVLLVLFFRASPPSRLPAHPLPFVPHVLSTTPAAHTYVRTVFQIYLQTCIIRRQGFPFPLPSASTFRALLSRIGFRHKAEALPSALGPTRPHFQAQGQGQGRRTGNEQGNGRRLFAAANMLITLAFGAVTVLWVARFGIAVRYLKQVCVYLRLCPSSRSGG